MTSAAHDPPRGDAHERPTTDDLGESSIREFVRERIADQREITESLVGDYGDETGAGIVKRNDLFFLWNMIWKILS